MREKGPISIGSFFIRAPILYWAIYVECGAGAFGATHAIALRITAMTPLVSQRRAVLVYAH